MSPGLLARGSPYLVSTDRSRIVSGLAALALGAAGSGVAASVGRSVIQVTNWHLSLSDPTEAGASALLVCTPLGRNVVSLFRRRVNYDRKRLLAEAERARAKGRCRRAVALFRRVLAVEPRNAELHARIAPLLAKTKQHFDAWQSFRLAGEALLNTNQAGESLALYREAARCLPRQIEAWQRLAELEHRLGRRKRAREILLRARRNFRSRRHRPQAIALLRAAREIEPWEADTVIDLARLLGSSRQAPEAQWLLEQLAQRSSGPQLRRVRRLQWRLEPSLRHTWYWLRAALGDGRSSKRPVTA